MNQKLLLLHADVGDPQGGRRAAWRRYGVAEGDRMLRHGFNVAERTLNGFLGSILTIEAGHKSDALLRTAVGGGLKRRQRDQR